MIYQAYSRSLFVKNSEKHGIFQDLIISVTPYKGDACEFLDQKCNVYSSIKNRENGYYNG